MRVTHVGNSPRDRGGISSVIRAYTELGDPDLDVRTIATYDSDSRPRTVARFAAALTRLAFTRRAELGVVHVHVSMRGSFVREGTALLLAATRRLPVVATVHGSRFTDWSARHPRLTGGVLRHADRVTVLSEGVAEHLRSLGVDGVVVVPNGVRVPPSGAAPTGEPVAVFAGELSRRKGVDVLLDAWPDVVRERPSARLRMIGPLVDVAPTTGVDYLGEQAHENVLAQLREAWVAVLASRFEGLPMFLLEAMAAGCGIVATPVGGIADLVPGRAGELGVGSTGELVAVGDRAGLAAALVAALDRTTATARGAAARALVAQRFSVDQMVARMRVVWREAAALRR